MSDHGLHFETELGSCALFWGRRGIRQLVIPDPVPGATLEDVLAPDWVHDAARRIKAFLAGEPELRRWHKAPPNQIVPHQHRDPFRVLAIRLMPPQPLHVLGVPHHQRNLAIICAAEEHPAHIALPRGCKEELQGLLAEHGSTLVIEDRRCPGDPLEVTFQGQLTEVQQAAVEAITPHDLGIFVAPPGTGKTVFGAHMVALRGVNTLVLVHRKPLLDQWCAQLQTFLGLRKKEVGQIGGGKQKATGRIDVAMIQSLASREGVLDLVGTYGHVIVDECHHAPAVSFERVMREVKARYVLGLTATPYRRDGLQRLLHFQCGPIRHQVHPFSREGQHPFANRLIVRETRFFGQGTIQDLYAALVVDPHRNAMIIQDVRRALSEGRSPIVLTERRDHLDLLMEALKDAAPHVVALHGGVPAKARRTALHRLAEVPPSEPRLILATGRYIGEGFDDARLDTLFMAMPIAWKGTLVQYAGRLHRLHPGKEEVRIYDYLDDSLALFRKMFEKRMRGYRAMGYRVDDVVAPPLLEGLGDS